MAKVIEIQVCGSAIAHDLQEACIEYVASTASVINREKLNFAIMLDNGEVKHITFRQTDNDIEVYGDFEGMPNALEWAMKGKEK